MTTTYFQNITRREVEECFSFPLDYIVNVPSNLIDYRAVLTAACASPYVKAMLSPRWLLNDGKHNVYSTTNAQLADEEVRKQVMQGVGLAHRTMGDVFTTEVFKLLGSLMGAFLFAETFYHMDLSFYKKTFQQGSLEPERPYEFKAFYLSMLIGQLEMHYPESFARRMAPDLCRRLNMSIEEVVGLAMRVTKLTGRPKLHFTIH